MHSKVENKGVYRNTSGNFKKFVNANDDKDEIYKTDYKITNVNILKKWQN